MRHALCLLALVLAGCVTTPGTVSQATTKLDGERQVIVEPGWLPTSGLSASLKLGGFWTDKQPKNFYLEVVSAGGHPVDTVKVSIDGEIIALDGGTPFTRTDPAFECGRRYVVPLSMIERLVSSKRTVFQATCDDGKVEGVFKGGPTTARNGFVSALKKIPATNGVLGGA